MSTENGLLVHGLKDPAVHGVGDWRELLTSVLQSKWPALSRSTSTKRAERELGIFGSPYYFYMMRTHEAYGFVVFLVEDMGQAESNADLGLMGASPFDSGGLWNGMIHPLDGSSDRTPTEELEDRKQLFSESEVPLDSWRPKFREYIRRNYARLGDYIRGYPPSHGTPPITNAAPVNEERAWTWEVRYPIALMPECVRLRCVCMHPDELEDYKNWLADNLEKLGVEQAKVLADWVKANVVVSEKPQHTAESLLETFVI